MKIETAKQLYQNKKILIWGTITILIVLIEISFCMVNGIPMIKLYTEIKMWFNSNVSELKNWQLVCVLLYIKLL